MAARRAHNPEVIGSNPIPATINTKIRTMCEFFVADPHQRINYLTNSILTLRPNTEAIF